MIGDPVHLVPFDKPIRVEPTSSCDSFNRRGAKAYQFLFKQQDRINFIRKYESLVKQIDNIIIFQNETGYIHVLYKTFVITINDENTVQNLYIKAPI